MPQRRISSPKDQLGSVVISAEHGRQLLEAYESAYPRECCGFLLGVPGRRASVNRVVTTLNADSGLGAFAIPDREIHRTKRIALEAGLSIIAMFHSHPDGSLELSDSDRDALCYSEWPWLLLTKECGMRQVQLTWFDRPKRRSSRSVRPCGCSS